MDPSFCRFKHSIFWKGFWLKYEDRTETGFEEDEEEFGGAFLITILIS